MSICSGGCVFEIVLKQLPFMQKSDLEHPCINFKVFSISFCKKTKGEEDEMFYRLDIPLRVCWAWCLWQRANFQIFPGVCPSLPPLTTSIESIYQVVQFWLNKGRGVKMILSTDKKNMNATKVGKRRGNKSGFTKKMARESSDDAVCDEQIWTQFNHPF